MIKIKEDKEKKCEENDNQKIVKSKYVKDVRYKVLRYSRLFDLFPSWTVGHSHIPDHFLSRT